ncbi:phosphoprotein phosphatase [Lactarius hatsudake]|nr:phosphoprotein phosphatase [Lactarius hatsudake]
MSESPTTSPSVPSPALSTLSLTDLKDVSDKDRQEAAQLKADANKAFLGHDFPRAAQLYSAAIDHNPGDATLFCNRAYTRIKLEEHGYALHDAARAIELNPKYAKAYYRRAMCHIQILKPQLAVTDLKKVLALEPQNAQVRKELESTQKLVRKIEFEKAIEMEEEKSAVDRCLEIIAEGACEVEKNYEGPRLETTDDGKFEITIEFIRSMMQWFKDGKALPRRYAWEIVLGAHDHFAKEESLVDVKVDKDVTIDVIGDVHGQFFDVLHLLSLTGEPSKDHILLMNGDLVDRGSWSVEVILTAFALKWLFPERMFINRGNHEAKEMNRTYGFEGEAKHKHGEQTYKLFAHVFTTCLFPNVCTVWDFRSQRALVPLATLVSATQPPAEKQDVILSPDGFKRYFITHGGLFGKDGITLDEIRANKANRSSAGDGRFDVQLLWTDPQESPGWGPSKRGVGIAFGPDVTRRWCNLNKVTGILRSHEVRQDGYAIEHGGLCTTVFSAPNYVDQGGNKGAFIRIDAEGTQKYIQFEAQPHPNVRPMAYQTGGLANLMM